MTGHDLHERAKARRRPIVAKAPVLLESLQIVEGQPYRARIVLEVTYRELVRTLWQYHNQQVEVSVWEAKAGTP
jgi:hypothetical protein